MKRDEQAFLNDAKSDGSFMSDKFRSSMKKSTKKLHDEMVMISTKLELDKNNKVSMIKVSAKYQHGAQFSHLFRDLEITGKFA